jgi:hypothetical protein
MPFIDLTRQDVVRSNEHSGDERDNRSMALVLYLAGLCPLVIILLLATCKILPIGKCSKVIRGDAKSFVRFGPGPNGKREYLPIWVLRLYGGYFVVCALGFEFWWTFGIVPPGDT